MPPLGRRPKPRTIPGAALAALGAAALAAPGPGCATTVAHAPDLRAIYDEPAQRIGDHRNPVILIPGILGSRLVDGGSGRVVWGAFSGDYADPEDAEGARLFALPMREGAPLVALEDGVRPDGVLAELKVDLLGLPLVLRAYFDILLTLAVGDYADSTLGESGAVDYKGQHYTCYQFDYDWRRDLAENAARLAAKVDEVSTHVQRRRGTEEPVQVDIVAHSMGGLVARYYLRYGSQPLPEDGSLPELTWSGASRVDRVIIVGTPNAGSVLALSQLVEGVRFAPVQGSFERTLWESRRLVIVAVVASVGIAFAARSTTSTSRSASRSWRRRST